MAQTRAKSYRLSPQEYLQGEADSRVRHEFVDGVAYAMAAGSQDHSTLAGQANAALLSQVAPPCRVFVSDMHLKAALNDADVY